MNNKQTGLFHIYCGDGKGKTTAAIGAAVRAAGAGLSVCFVQMMKSGTSSELQILKNMANLTVRDVVNPYGFTWRMTSNEKEQLKKLNDRAIEELINVMEKKYFDVIIIDELIAAYENELVDKSLVFTMIEKCKSNTELIFTGRNPADELMEKADYITEMQCRRHPYKKGINARLGIEL